MGDHRYNFIFLNWFVFLVRYFLSDFQAAKLYQMVIKKKKKKNKDSANLKLGNKSIIYN